MDEGVGVGNQRLAEGFVVEQASDGGSQRLGIGSEQQVFAVDSAKGGIGQRSSDAGNSHGHSFEKLVLESGSDSHGRYKETSRSIARTDVIDRASDGDFVGSQLTNCLFWRGSSQQDSRLGVGAPDNGHHLIDKELRGIDVGSILHVAAKDYGECLSV